MDKNHITVGGICHGCKRYRLTFQDTGMCWECTSDAAAMTEFVVGNSCLTFFRKSFLSELNKAQCWVNGFNPHTIAQNLSNQLDEDLGKTSTASNLKN